MTEAADPDGHLPAADPLDGEPPGVGVHDVISTLGRELAGVLRSTPHQPSRVRVQFGHASLEVEWSKAEPVRDTRSEREPSVPAEEMATVTAPLVGTFYRAPEPDAHPYVQTGDDVQVGQQVGIVEAMKLMNPITAEVSGRILNILVGDADPVEYGQPLMTLKPSPSG